jgi:hypothetical protein
MSTNKYWATAEEAFRKGDGSLFPCPAEFYTDILEVVPPAIMDFHPAFGCYFANGEPVALNEAVNGERVKIEPLGRFLHRDKPRWLLLLQGHRCIRLLHTAEN